MKHTRKVLKYWLVFLTLVLQQITRTYTAACEPIQIPMCKTMAYNKTRMPNLLHHSTQENAKLAIEQFEELLATNCSEYLLFFLCSMYAPICTVQFQTDAIQPCKSVCQHARDGCEPIMLRHKIPWPDYLACDELPVYDRGVCISPEAIVTTSPEGTVTEKPPTDGEDGSRPGRGRKGGVCNNCKKKTKASKNTYVKNKYEYAIQAEVVSFHSERHTDMVSTTVNVKSTLKHSTIDIPEGEIRLWTNNSCVCPKVEENKEYMIAGHEDPDNGKLLLLPNSLVETWKNKFVNSIKKWEKKLKKTSSKRRKGSKDKSRRRKGSKTETASVAPASSGSKRRSGGSRRRSKPSTEE